MSAESSSRNPKGNQVEFDPRRIRVYPLADRRSLTRVEDVLIDPDASPQDCEPRLSDKVQACSDQILEASRKGSAVILIYGAHLLRNGAALILERMMARGWITHLATNGAGSIHDWEYAFLGRSTECVRSNVADGKFGTWDETSRYIHLALMTGALRPEGYGAAVGRMIMEDGVMLPDRESVERDLRSEPGHPLSPARADLLQTLRRFDLKPGRLRISHSWKQASILAQAFKHALPMTVHPGIGYDIISNHPIFNGAAIGRAAELDFQTFGQSVTRLDDGVVLSIGSAIMGPQVFEKSLSCVNNLRIQAGQSVVARHTIYVVDIQNGGNWDWSEGEPPKTNPAYYLRFCKSYSRMGGTMRYLECDNVTFLHNLYYRLCHC